MNGSKMKHRTSYCGSSGPYFIWKMKMTGIVNLKENFIKRHYNKFRPVLVTILLAPFFIQKKKKKIGTAIFKDTWCFTVKSF